MTHPLEYLFSRNKIDGLARLMCLSKKIFSINLALRLTRGKFWKDCWAYLQFRTLRSKFMKMGSIVQAIADRWNISKALSDGRGILITGSTGVGKTTLIQKAFLVEKVLPLTKDGKPALTTEVLDYTGKVGEDGVVLVFTDTPGDQLAKKILVEDGLIPRVDGGQIQGIINVVAAGFSNISSTEGDVEFSEDYKRAMISADEVYLSGLLDSVSQIDDDVWFTTVVNKRDRWDGYSDVDQLYGLESNYGKILRNKTNGPKGQLHSVSTSCHEEGSFGELYDTLKRNLRKAEGVQ